MTPHPLSLCRCFPISALLATLQTSSRVVRRRRLAFRKMCYPWLLSDARTCFAAGLSSISDRSSHQTIAQSGAENQLTAVPELVDACMQGDQLDSVADLKGPSCR